MPETTEEISRQPEVRKELARATGEKRGERVKARGRDKFWFVVYAVILVGCGVIYYLFTWKLIPLPQPGAGITERFLRGGALIVIMLTIARATSVYALARIEDASTRFTLQRVMHLAVVLIIAVIVVSTIFVNWYAGLAALGIGSIIIGLAVQTPMKSFIAWIYILVRQPYRVGDRISRRRIGTDRFLQPGVPQNKPRGVRDPEEQRHERNAGHFRFEPGRATRLDQPAKKEFLDQAGFDEQPDETNRDADGELSGV